MSARVTPLACLLIVGSACRSAPAEAEAADQRCTLVPQGSGPAGGLAPAVDTVVSGLEVPWAIGFLPDGSWLVNERAGRIRLVRQGRLVESPVATITAVATGEGGLLGLALHPRFAQNRFFYVYYTAQSPAGARNRIERWRLGDDGATAAADRVILDGIPAAQFHDGGRLCFGPDGMLYAGTGDAGQPSRAQDPGSPAGKILRLTDEGAIPADNPLPGQAAYVLGVRNVEAFAWADPRTLYVADHGPSGELGRSGHDEVSVATGGTNLGWPTIYGCQARPGLRAPALTWTQAVPPGGAAVYTGDAIPAWRGDLLIGTLASQHLHRVSIDLGSGRVRAHEVYLSGTYGRLREVAMGPDGQLYVTTSNCDGRGVCPPEKDKILRVGAPR